MSEAIHFAREGRLGLVTLDRQGALNALTHEMVRAMSRQLTAWKDDPAVAVVVVTAAPGRAFCAGGDIRAVVERARTAGVAATVPFFHDEYRLNWRIARYPKPYIALIDGVTMGGGVGISVHGRFRVATERTLFAMPETGIGFFPDVGGTWFLPRCPGETGLLLGLTGARAAPGDCMALGLATHFVPSQTLARVIAELAEGRAPGEALAAHAAPAPSSPIMAQRGLIDACLAGASLAEVLRALSVEPSGWGAERLAELSPKSPLALRLTFAQLRRGRVLASLEEALRLEYRMVHRVLALPDFAEGVRALIVDKDRRPRWRDRSPADIDEAEIAACMAPLPEGDLAFDWDDV